MLIPEIQNEISIAVRGRESVVIRNEGIEMPVVVTGAVGPEEVLLRTASGEYVRSEGIIDMSMVRSISTIPRFNGDYAMTITADYANDSDKAEALKDVKDGIDDLDMENIAVSYEGEAQLINENFGQIGILGVVALAVVFIILLIQFKSYYLPLLIFITIPLSAVGSVAGLFITGQAVSFTAMLGIVSLLGIVVNNAIILIDYIKKEISRGVKIKKACLNASARRLRPILLSTFTTVIGLIPLTLGNNDLFRPMAIALMSGLLVSTLLTLVVLPVFVSSVYKNPKRRAKDRL